MSPYDFERKSPRAIAIAGVYFLFNNRNKIVYVGRSVNIEKRVYQHFIQKKKKFTSYSFIQTAHAEYLEIQYIKEYSPLYNDTYCNSRNYTPVNLKNYLIRQKLTEENIISKRTRIL